LARQNYPSFQLYCIFDDVNDPAVACVKAELTEFMRPPLLLFTTEISQNRSLKCNSIDFAIAQLENFRVDFPAEVVAFLDADTVPDQNWLRDLIAPLVDRRIGVTTGTRWFSPSDLSWGSLVRFVWNAAAIVQMHGYHIAWGGSWACQIDALRNSGLATHLRNAFCEDTALNRVFKQKKVVHVPTLVVNNEESTDICSAANFITRQLLALRLYHHAWPWVAAHATLVLAVNLLGLVCVVACAAVGQYAEMTAAIAGYLVFQTTNVGLLALIERCNRSILNRRGQLTCSLIFRSPIRIGIATLLSQAIHVYATFRCWFTGRIWWRGIEYQIDRQARIQMTSYQPFTGVYRDNELGGRTADPRTKPVNASIN
jgi:hypothetical protein